MPQSRNGCGRRGFLVAAACASFGFATPTSVVAADGGPQPARIVFLVNAEPDNYEADRTIPALATSIRERRGHACVVIRGEGPLTGLRFPGLETLDDADLLVIFFRRSALTPEQFGRIRRHLTAGKPLAGIRTANHAFSVKDTPAPGHEKWWEFVPQALGCENRGSGGVAAGVDVAVAAGRADHPILTGVEP